MSEPEPAADEPGEVREADADAGTATGAAGSGTAGGDRNGGVRVENLTKVFLEDSGSEVVAVDDVSVDIEPGEFLVLVGPSGCGKTTTLRTVAGLEEPTEGRIYIDGRDVSGLEPRERDVAMVFQNYALYPHKTVRGNLAFPLEIRKFPREEVDRRVEETAELLGIGELMERHPSDLSGGQQQRVALGRAIVRDPEVFLFDEPLSNLDAKLRIQMRTELNKLHERVGKTSIYVTHDQAEAMTLGDRVAVMNDGRIQQLDPPQVVYDRPANRFVAGFIGEPPMNFFDATLDPSGDGTLVKADGFELPLAPAQAEAVAGHDGPVTYGARPEHLRDAALQEDPDPARTFEAEVRVVEPMGSAIDLALVPVGADDPVEFTARVAADSEAAAGDRVTLLVDVPKTHVFDARTGENLTR